VASAEESIWRGYWQAELEERFGPLTGLSIAALTFGGVHYFNGKTPEEGWTNVAFATAAGYYFGWLAQSDGYRLEKPIAAHFWWNVVQGGVGFLVDPKNNALNVKVDFMI
jgi:membrane protease YdiL (CAAX protease family)